VAIAVEQLITSEILKPARYLGNERGSVHKPWSAAEVRWVLTYPEVYEVGSSNLGHIILYNILNAQPRQLCDRAYLPGPDLAARLRQTATPLFAVEARRPLIEFDILGFSLSYELGATNILEMLNLANIPLTWQERQYAPLPGGGQGEGAIAALPLIFAGGQTATSNPEPYAEFFDFVVLGDGEEVLPEIGLVIQEGKAARLSRQELLLDLAQVPGVYVPQFYEMAADGSVHPNHPEVPVRILRRVATPMPAYSIGLVPYVQTVHDRLTVEIRRGCTRGCRFCQPGMLTRPARDVEPDAVIDAIAKGIRQTGYDEFSLLSLSCSDYLSLPAVGLEIKNRLRDENISLSLPSQRVDRFDENIANIIGGTRQTSLTFAPEAGTQRMRDIVNKGLTNEELLRGVKTAFEQGWDKIKLYFMIGLPGETDADVLGIAETVRWLQRECRQPGRKRLSLNLTISNFTPKPHTPFQWHSVSTAEFRRKQILLQEAFRSLKGLKVNFTDVRISAMEDFVGRGDRRLAAVVRRAWELGAGMDSWWESLDRAYAAWEQAISEAGLTWKYRQVEQGEWNLFQGSEGLASVPADGSNSDLDAPLPWDHLDTGISKTWLKEDLERALAAASVPDCSYEGCSHCGVCTPDFGHNVVVPPPPIPEFTGHFTPNQERQQRLRFRFGKLGSLTLLSHLDLVRLVDRAVRRAALPVAYTGGYHPMPRIAIVSALPLGVSSSGELLDLELTQSLDPEELCQRLQAELPDEMPLYGVEEIGLKQPSANQLLDRATYILQTAPVVEGDSSEAPDVAMADWEAAIAQILASSEIWVDYTTKSGKTQTLNLRDRLFALEILHDWPLNLTNATLAPAIADAVRQVSHWSPQPASVCLQYTGSYRNDGTILRPEQVGVMLGQAIGCSVECLKIHRLGFDLT